MKKIKLALTLLFLAPLFSMAQEKGESFVVKGRVGNYTGNKLTLTVWEGNKSYYSSVDVVDGKFTYTGTTSEARVIRFNFNDERMLKMVGGGAYIPVKSANAWCVVYPGANIKLSGKLTDFPEVFASDSYENKTFAKFLKKYFPLVNESANISVKMEVDTTLSKEAIEKMKEEEKILNKKSMAMLKEYVAKHTSSHAALWFIDDMMLRKQLTVEEAKVLIADVDKKYTTTGFYKVVEARVNSTKYEVGKKIDQLISSNTLDGSKFDLASLKGKFVLIDFWGSWCSPCMIGMPSIKALRDKYPDKLAILGIAQDKEESWKQAIKRSELNWIHLLDGNGEEGFVSKFNITGFPTKILVSPEGVILYRSSGESKEAYQKMEDLINKK